MRRGIVLGLLTVLAVASMIAMFRFAKSGADTDPADKLLGDKSDFPPNSVTYVPSAQVFVVNWGNGIRVLDETPPEWWISNERNTRCNVRYYYQPSDDPSSDLVAAVDAGVAYPSGGHFKGSCGATHFSWWRGEDLQRPCRCGLDHYPVRMDGERVFVDLKARRPFTWAY